ncbi:hypothetical protein G6F49_013333 [Rhizopus delemar]|nr:hypothetical protein G6F49_013333 [Rhizopus delemar]
MSKDQLRIIRCAFLNNYGSTSSRRENYETLGQFCGSLYKHPVSQTNSNSKHVHFEEEADESTEEEYSSEEESIEHSDEDIYSAEDELSDREHQEEDNDQSLLVLEKESDQEIEIITNNNDQIIRAPKEGMILKAYTSILN